MQRLFGQVGTNGRAAPLQPPAWSHLPSPETKDAAGACVAERLVLDEGLAVVRSRYRPQHDLVEPTANPTGSRTLVFTFGLEGASGYTGRDGADLAFRHGHTTVASLQGSVGKRRFAAGATVSQLRLVVDEAVLTRYLSAERSELPLPRDCVRRPDFRKTSRAATAHALALAREERGSHGQACIVGPTGSADPRPHPAGRTVALAERSPHRLLQNLRMQHAHSLLEGGCQVAQAGWQVGYEHPSNFSAAFTKHFGYSPKSVQL